MRRRQAAAVAVGMMLGGALPLVTAGPAQACSCAGWDDIQAYAGADAVFAATLRNPELPGEQDYERPRVFDFEVDAVYKGDVVRQQRVVSIGSGSTCGAELDGNGPFLVFATRDRQQFDDAVPDGELFTGLCNGTRKLADRAVSFRNAAEPLPGASASLAVNADRDLWTAAAVGGGAVVAAALGILVWRRRRAT